MNKIEDIELVTQPTSNTCASACLSMMTGIDVQEVVDKFHQKFCDRKTNAFEFLKENVNKDKFNILVMKHQWHPTLNDCEEGLYLCNVPSLNSQADFHYVVVAYYEGLYRVLDPNIGRENTQYYTINKSLDEDELSVELCAYDIEIGLVNAHQDWLCFGLLSYGRLESTRVNH